MRKKNKKIKAKDRKSVFWQRLLDIILFVGAPFGIPALRLFQKGNQLRPRKWFWMLAGGVSFAAVVAGYVLVVMEQPYVIYAAWIGMIVVSIYSIYIDREYVLKFNVMVDAGYFEDQQRMLEANRVRQDQTWIHEAQDGMDKIMGTETRVKESREVKAAEYKRREAPAAPVVVSHETMEPEPEIVIESAQKRKLEL